MSDFLLFRWVWICGPALLCSATAPVTVAAEGVASVDWRMYNGGYTADRFSKLQQITRRNVGSLKEAGRYVLPETTSFESGPVILGDTLYIPTATGTYALNAIDGKLNWSHHLHLFAAGNSSAF
jgi:glucose dehydrogenase